MKKLEHKLLSCVICTIGINCYVVGHNLVHASVQKLKYRTRKQVLNNNELLTLSKHDDKKLTE